MSVRHGLFGATHKAEPLVTRRIAIVWITLAAAGVSDTACNAILGNQVHELAPSAIEDGSAATDGPSDTFDGPAEGRAPAALLDATASPDAADEMDGLPSSSEGAFDSDAGDVSAADAVDSQASPQNAPDGSFDASDAAVEDAGLEASDGAADAMRDAATCANGIGGLSNIGTQDFRISFRILTTQRGWVALLNQRGACTTGYFWDIRQCTPGRVGCPADGTVFVETDNNDNPSYQALFSKGTINDGNPHDVVVARIAGTLTIYIDGATSGAEASVASFGNAMPPLQVGKDACIGAPAGDPTVALTGTLSNLCITSP